VIGMSILSAMRLQGWARRAAALLALVGLLVHAGVPLLHQARAAAASPLDDSVLICSGFGVKVVQLAELEGATDHGQKQKSRIYYCPICLAQQSAVAAILPDAVPLAAPALAGAAPAFPPPALFLAQDHYPSARARAPPLIA
jgi:hypothetical protein